MRICEIDAMTLETLPGSIRQVPRGYSVAPTCTGALPASATALVASDGAARPCPFAPQPATSKQPAASRARNGAFAVTFRKTKAERRGSLTRVVAEVACFDDASRGVVVGC